MKYLLFTALLIVQIQRGISQPVLQTPEQAWWNVIHYALQITPNFDKKYINGSNEIRFRVVDTGRLMQIDLQEPLSITSIVWHNTALKIDKKKKDGYLVQFPTALQKEKIETITLYFEGLPKVSVKAPWDNGWIWATDKKGRPWMSVTCEGAGASIWFPCKDVLCDEPDSGASISLTVPDTLVAVANGRLLQKTVNTNATTTYTWAVVNTINNYNIIPYIGKYVSWHKNYPGEKGKLDCDYWVLDYNLDKAKKQFLQADSMLQCFEYWMGPYPFYEDGYKLVEAPSLGMEHQSAIAYGNEFGNGFKGRDLSGTGWGLKWDFILVHESGHEWFGNSITARGYADTWIHEGFTKYLETIYTTYISGTEAGNDYAIGIRKKILNDKPIVGSTSSDQYNKGSTLLHMIRQLLDDAAFRKLLRAMNKNFYHQNVSTDQIVRFINQFSKQDFTKTAEQYLRTTQIPVLEYTFTNLEFKYRWANCIDGFDMPLQVSFDGRKNRLLKPTEKWQKLAMPGGAEKTFSVDRNFYADSKLIVQSPAGN
ncbi:MAG: M1 family metallopeptidase [Chitinophagaceae bacterium]